MSLFGFLAPSLEERQWLVAQGKKLWWLMPITIGSVFFVPQVFLLIDTLIWVVLGTSIVMRMWIHKAFETQNFKNVLLYKVVDTTVFGLILGYAAVVLTAAFIVSPS